MENNLYPNYNVANKCDEALCMHHLAFQVIICFFLKKVNNSHEDTRNFT